MFLQASQKQLQLISSLNFRGSFYFANKYKEKYLQPSEKFQLQKNDFNTYRNLRIYQYMSNYSLINQYVCNKFVSIQFFAENSYQIYKAMTKVFGHKIVNFFITNTMGRVFIAGDTLDKALKRQEELENQGIHCIFDYSCEALQDLDNENFFDDCQKEFLKVVERLGKSNTYGKQVPNIVGMKLSALFPLDIQKKLNNNEQKIAEFVEQNFELNTFTAKELQNALEKNGLKVTEEEIVEFSEKYLNIKKPFQEIQIDSLSWLINVRAYYLDASLNENKIIQHFSTFSKEENEKIVRASNRFESIIKKAYNYGIRILVDAEQSYLQRNIELFTDHMQKKYNTQQPIVYSTIQGYLRNTTLKCHLQNQKKGMEYLCSNQVRGAYMTEERSLFYDEQDQTIWNSIEETHESYNRSAEYLFNELNENDELFIASHNEISSLLVQQWIEKNPQKKKNVYFAQLLGLADQVTQILKQKNAQVYKYVPYGPTEILIPYLCRRAQEQYHTMGSLNLQNRLMIEELKFRFTFGSK